MNDMTTLTIIKTVFDYFGLPIDAGIKRSRKRELVKARQYSMYFLRKYTSATLLQTGQMFGRNHATVISACNKVEFESEHYDDTRRDVERLGQLIYNRITPEYFRYENYDTDKT